MPGGSDSVFCVLPNGDSGYGFVRDVVLSGTEFVGAAGEQGSLFRRYAPKSGKPFQRERAVFCGKRFGKAFLCSAGRRFGGLFGGVCRKQSTGDKHACSDKQTTCSDKQTTDGEQDAFLQQKTGYRPGCNYSGGGNLFGSNQHPAADGVRNDGLHRWRQ